MTDEAAKEWAPGAKKKAVEEAKAAAQQAAAQAAQQVAAQAAQQAAAQTPQQPPPAKPKGKTGFWRKAWAWVRLLRLEQWTKNGVVFVAFFFALGDRAQQLHGWHGTWRTGLLAAAAALAFGVVASAVYILNDWEDREADARHPVKRKRPIASGEVRPGPALALAAVLALAGVAGGWLLAGPGVGSVLAGYLAMQIAYTLGLKRVAVLDVMIIAAGFVLRAVAGALAVDVAISPWLLLCAFWLALFLALCKRRHEKARIGGVARAALARYDKKMLDLSIAATTAVALVSYSIYTLWPDTVAKFGTAWLGATVPFVAYGLFRYLELVYSHDHGERPEAVLLTDVPLIVDILGFAAAVAAVFWFARG